MERPLKILWLGRILPVPLDTGDRIYSARLVEAVGRAAGAEVDYLGLANPEAPQLGAELLDPAVTWNVVPGAPNSLLRSLLSREPRAGGQFSTPNYRRQLAAILERGYDAIILDHYALAWALPIIRRCQPAGHRALLVHLAHDYETEVTRDIARDFRGNPVRRLLLYVNSLKAASAERRLAAGCDMLIALTDHDAGAFRALKPPLKTLTIPPGYSGPRRLEREIGMATPRRLAILGSYRWIAKQMNLEAFLEVADARFAAAGIELIVIGDAEPSFRQRWEPRLKATRFLGFVDDLVATLDQTRMGLVVEATGGGFKLKVLDYVFLRQPVAALAPSLGGQPEAVTRHFVVAPDADALCDRIIEVIDDIDALNAMQDGAYRAAEPLFSWDENGARIVAAIRAEG